MSAPAYLSCRRPALALRFSADTRLKSAIVLVMLAAACLICRARSLEVPFADIWPPIALVCGLLGVAAYYRARGEEVLVLCLTTLVHIVAFVSCYIVLTYAVATLALPLADAPLAAFDDWCSVRTPQVRQWASAHPMIDIMLRFAYDTLLYQTALVIVLLGLGGDRRRLEMFMFAFMLAALVSLLVFMAMPASGPFVNYGFATSADQARYLEHFESLRSGSRTLVSYRGAEGLITFPSFHVVWAILLTWALRGRRRVFAVLAVLNLLVVVSTMTTGWHYFADVLGGVGVAVVAIGMAHRTRRVVASRG